MAGTDQRWDERAFLISPHYLCQLLAAVEAVFSFTKVATGMNVTIELTKGFTTAFQVLPTGFDYHVHVNRVSNGDCGSTGGHLDPTQIGTKVCDPKNSTTCQVGDLAAKHGNIVAEAASQSGALPTITYIDTELTFSGPNSLLDRSIVIHNNGTRIACADIIVDGYVSNTTSNNTTGTNPSDTNKPSSAVKLVGSVALSGFVAVMMMAL